MKRVITKIIVCPKCKGEGYVTETSFEGHSRGYDNHRIRCDECWTSGLVRRTIEIKNEPYTINKE